MQPISAPYVKQTLLRVKNRFFSLIILVAILALAACRTPSAEHGTATPPPWAALVAATSTPVATPSPTGTRPPTAYPPPQSTAAPGIYPAQPTASAQPVATSKDGQAVDERLYLPAVGEAKDLPTPTATLTPTPPPTPTPTIDFSAVRAALQANNKELGFVKMGFHVGPGGNQTGLGNWMRRLDAAGVPFFLKSVDHAGPLVEAQEMMRESGVAHTLVYRTTGNGYDVPDYSLPPDEAARAHWALHKASFPPELDPSLVWIETINEVDKNRAPWLARFALETAHLALADGHRWAAFGWSSGEPEPHQWELPAMLDFLRLAAAHPERLAIALHEYSYLVTDIGHDYPYKVGRFQQLFEVTDRHNIPRPTVLITEWGWAYDDVPSPGSALRDITWAAELYAPYPQVRGAAIWYLGPGYAGIADATQMLIAPVRDYALGNYFAIPPSPTPAPINPFAHPPPPPS